jgi:hypothetical protein
MVMKVFILSHYEFVTKKLYQSKRKLNFISLEFSLVFL